MEAFRGIEKDIPRNNCTYLGIDPGPNKTAWALINVDNNYDVTILESKHAKNDEALTVFTTLGTRTDIVAVEMVASYGMPVGKTVFETCVWLGRFIDRIYVTSDVPIVYITRNMVKLEICKSPKANDATIRQALIDMFGGTKAAAIGTKKNQGPLYGMNVDQRAALAVALSAVTLDSDKFYKLANHVRNNTIIEEA